MGCISEKFDKYLSVPEVVRLACNVFEVLNDDLTTDVFNNKVSYFRSLLSIINVKFSLCTDNCLGINYCSCIENELRSFYSHFFRFKLKTSQNNIDYKAILSFYISVKNIETVSKLHIPNVIRALEVVQLLKASQSNTKRVMSVIAKAVKGEYENVDRFGRHQKHDVVNASVFISCNTKVIELDKKLASQNYLKNGHFNVLMKTKPFHTKSKTIKRLINKKGKSKQNGNVKISKKMLALLDVNNYNKSSHNDCINTNIQI